MRCALFPNSKKRETYLLFIMLLLRLLQFSCQAGCRPLKSKRKEQTSSLTELDDIDKNIASRHMSLIIIFDYWGFEKCIYSHNKQIIKTY